ncbi:beta-ketoacyl synthase N-terminal-like domain-containing protein [Nocardia wallacei]|uniref:beta-ketoacyl synthase N-terminal-like domain-containing protein n=1 Tax=Nocardia wallacei TaxID=480035 RepID=UPI002457B7F2|nr:beta-ketoacyl synthase N-terminal-like domain-containing protein [Nocardia wallacei]
MRDDDAPIAITGIGVASDRHHTADDLLDPAARAPGDAADRLRRELGRGYRYKDRATKLGVLAAIRALRDNGQDSPAATTGVVVSSNFGNLQTVCDTARVIHAEGAGATSPMELPNASSNVIASTLAIHLGLRGPNVTLCNGAPSGLDALGWAVVLLRARRAHRVVVVGTESATEAAAALQDCAPAHLFDGAAALVVERSTTAPALRVHHCCRGTDPADATARALTATGHPPIDLWLGPRHAAAHTPTDTRNPPITLRPGTSRATRHTTTDTRNSTANLRARTGYTAGRADVDTGKEPVGPRGGIGRIAAEVDAEEYLGRAGGALGVVQCVIAHRWLVRHGGIRALAVAGNAVEGAGAVVLSREGAS